MSQNSFKVEVENGKYSTKINGYIWKERGSYFDTYITLERMIYEDGSFGDWHIGMSTALPVDIEKAKVMLNCYNAAFAEMEKIERFVK